MEQQVFFQAKHSGPDQLTMLEIVQNSLRPLIKKQNKQKEVEFFSELEQLINKHYGVANKPIILSNFVIKNKQLDDPRVPDIGKSSDKALTTVGPQSNEIPGEADHHSEYSSDDAPDISTNAHFGHLRYKKKPAFRKEVFKRKMETKEAKAGIENNNEGDSSSDLSSDVSTNFYFGNLQYRKATATSKEPVKSSVIESNLQHNYDPPKEQDKKMSKNVLPCISNKENIYTVAKGFPENSCKDQADNNIIDEGIATSSSGCFSDEPQSVEPKKKGRSQKLNSSNSIEEANESLETSATRASLRTSNKISYSAFFNNKVPAVSSKAKKLKTEKKHESSLITNKFNPTHTSSQIKEFPQKEKDFGNIKKRGRPPKKQKKSTQKTDKSKTGKETESSSERDRQSPTRPNEKEEENIVQEADISNNGDYRDTCQTFLTGLLEKKGDQDHHVPKKRKLCESKQQNGVVNNEKLKEKGTSKLSLAKKVCRNRSFTIVPATEKTNLSMPVMPKRRFLFTDHHEPINMPTFK